MQLKNKKIKIPKAFMRIDNKPTVWIYALSRSCIAVGPWRPFWADSWNITKTRVYREGDDYVVEIPDTWFNYYESLNSIIEVSGDGDWALLTYSTHIPVVGDGYVPYE